MKNLQKLSRRNFLGIGAGAVAGGLLSAPMGQLHAQAATESLDFVDSKTLNGPYEVDRTGKPPNIFLITMDMVSPDLYHPSRPSSRHVHLPAIRSLMQDGVFFSNAFCTVPICSPSRASYLTGRYSYIVGNGERAPDGFTTELRPSDVIFAEYLNASGYVARQAGKSHVGNANFLKAFGDNDNPWDRWSPPIYADDGFLDYQRRLGIEPQKYSREITFLQQDRKSPGNSVGGWIEQQNGKPFPLEAQYSYYLGELAYQTLLDMTSSPATKGKPVYFELDIFDPHQPLSIPEGFEKRAAELRQSLTLPETYREVQAKNWAPVASQPPVYDLYRKYWGLYDPQSLKEYMVGYALQMELVDMVVGRFLDRLKSLGLYDNSLILLMSDHGEMDGHWALIDKGCFLYPDVVRVPLFMKPPASMNDKLPGNNHTVTTSVSLLDVAPTVLSAAGIEAKANFDGRSLFEHLQPEKSAQNRTLLFFGGWHVGVNYPVGTEMQFADGSHYMYTFDTSSSVDELYDLNSIDAVNLVGNSKYEEVRKQMLLKLADAVEKDPRWLGYWAILRIQKYFELPRSSQNGNMQLLNAR